MRRLFMGDAEAALALRHLFEGMVYLKWGSGESILAFAASASRAYAVEHDCTSLEGGGPAAAGALRQCGCRTCRV